MVECVLKKLPRGLSLLGGLRNTQVVLTALALFYAFKNRCGARYQKPTERGSCWRRCQAHWTAPGHGHGSRNRTASLCALLNVRSRVIFRSSQVSGRARGARRGASRWYRRRPGTLADDQAGGDGSLGGVQFLSGTKSKEWFSIYSRLEMTEVRELPLESVLWVWEVYKL